MQIAKIWRAVAGLALAAVAVSAQAAFVDVDLAGFQTNGEFGDPNNSSRSVFVAGGASITGFDWLDLAFTTSAASLLSEFTLSVNNADGTAFLDWAPSTEAASGTYGPDSGSWNGSTGAPGPFGAGAPFTAAGGELFVTAYEAVDDPGVDATVSSGTLRIFYDLPDVPGTVPEPSTLAMVPLALIGIAVARRQRPVKPAA